MKNKITILILFFIIIVLLCTNIKIILDKNKIIKEIETVNIEKEDLKDIAPAKETAYLRGLGDVKLHFYPDGHPAFGYKANVNTFVRSDDNKVEIIDSNEKWVKVNISGWIPKWYLSSNPTKDDEIFPSLSTEKRTVKKDCRLYLTPEENNDVVDSQLLKYDSDRVNLYSGQVVQLVYEYKEWYYVKRYILWDANHYREGWIKKSNLATFEEMKPSEVLIKKGTIIYSATSDFKNPIELDKDIYGRIINKIDEWYEILIPGAGFLRVKQGDVTYKDEI